MVIKKGDLAKRPFPGPFTNATSKNDKVICDSLDLCKLNAKLQHSLNEIYCLCRNTVVQLNDSIRENIGHLYKVCEAIAMLDMVLSYWRTSTYVRCNRLLIILVIKIWVYIIYR